MNRKNLLVIVGFLMLGFSAIAQQPPFQKDVIEFKKQDSALFPPKKSILFIGSSSFTKWKDVNDYFPGYGIINRGFGGSTLLDQIRYVNDIVFPYQPRQIVIYCGENDVASSDTISAQTVFNRFIKLYELIREKLPKTSVVFVSLKPSPSRARHDAKVRETNSLIKDFLQNKKHTAFVDVYTPMLDAGGKSRPELFVEDMLHMNKQGYAIWQKAIEPYLKKK